MKNSPKTLWQSLQSSVQGITGKEDIGQIQKQDYEEIHSFARKIRFYPTGEQKKLLELCFGATRYLRNKAVSGLKDGTVTDSNFFSLRNKFVLTNEELDKPGNEKERWLKNIPFDTRQLVLKRLSVDYKTNLQQVEDGKKESFDMKFKSKKNPKQYCFVDKRTLKPKTLKLFPRINKEPIRLRPKMERWWKRNIKKIESNFIVIRDKIRYYICLSMTKNKEEPDSHRDDCVSLDPGVRTFQTFYSEGNIGKIGDNICKTLLKKAEKEDKIKSIIDDKMFLIRKRNKKNLKKRCFLLRTKMKNIVNDLHWKTCHFLCTKFKNVLLPKFNVKPMTEKSKSIHSAVTRSMLALSHYKFKERLLYKAKTMGTKVHICDESYTTKTCGSCGIMKEMKRMKSFECPNCFIKIDRDYNGARNIYLKNIREFVGSF
jgi:putative transposase